MDDLLDRLRSDQGRTFLWAAAIGSVSAFVVFKVVGYVLDKQLATGGRGLLQSVAPELERQIDSQLQTQVPPMVRREIQAKLTDYGITPTTGRRMDRALASMERLGWI